MAFLISCLRCVEIFMEYKLKKHEWSVLTFGCSHTKKTITGWLPTLIRLGKKHTSSVNVKCTIGSYPLFKNYWSNGIHIWEKISDDFEHLTRSMIGVTQSMCMFDDNYLKARMRNAYMKQSISSALMLFFLQSGIKNVIFFIHLIGKAIANYWMYSTFKKI